LKSCEDLLLSFGGHAQAAGDAGRRAAAHERPQLALTDPEPLPDRRADG